MVEPSVLDDWESALNGATQFYELEDMAVVFFFFLNVFSFSRWRC